MEELENYLDFLLNKINAYYEFPAEVLENIQKIIDDIWSDTDPSTMELRHQMFPNGKPSVREFIDEMSILPVNK